jgi:hypothetical protein
VDQRGGLERELDLYLCIKIRKGHKPRTPSCYGQPEMGVLVLQMQAAELCQQPSEQVQILPWIFAFLLEIGSFLCIPSWPQTRDPPV